MTGSIAWHLGSVGRVDNGDGRYTIWNVAWVARTAIVDPVHVFDANIFYPHRWTLVYSETNLGAGLLAIPAYWVSRNPYAAYNFAFLSSFILSALGTYYLVRRLTADRRAAAVSATCFAFCPYVFSHTPHIHLMMTAGLPFSMLALHRLVDRPDVRRGAALGLVMALQTWFCGYYGVFVALVVAFGVCALAVMHGLWTNRRFWVALMVAAAVALAGALPLFLLYARLQETTGFARSFEESFAWAADWRAYLASSAYLHRWLLPLLGSWRGVLFPGFVSVALGIGAIATRRTLTVRTRNHLTLYAILAVAAFWASFGPAAGLYTVLYHALPVFSFMRAPERLGLVVAFALSVLAGITVSTILRRASRPGLIATALIALSIADLKVPLYFQSVQPIDPVYRILAALPPGPLLEVPVYAGRLAVARTQYMLNSTAHWMPLVNAYSSYTPIDFLEKEAVLGGFPSDESLTVLGRDRVRYVMVHHETFRPDVRRRLNERLWEFRSRLIRRYADNRSWLYEIVTSPP